MYTRVFGHSKLFNIFVNRFSDWSIHIDDTATIGTRTNFYGDISIGPNVSLSQSVELSGTVRVGEGSNLNGDNSVSGNVQIGKYCAIAPRARMLSINHATYKPGIQMELYRNIGSSLPHVSKGPIEVGNDVWIGSDSKILSGVSVGDGAVIAADSVVVDDVEPYSIVAGNPATHKRYRFDESTREALHDIAWWNWSSEKIRKNQKFFDADLRAVDDVKELVT